MYTGNVGFEKHMTLDMGTKPHGLVVNFVSSDKKTVFLGDYEISLEDFLVAAHYILTNSNLHGDNDPRLQFVKSVQAMKTEDGHTLKDDIPVKRLVTDVPPVHID